MKKHTNVIIILGKTEIMDSGGHTPRSSWSSSWCVTALPLAFCIRPGLETIVDVAGPPLNSVSTTESEMLLSDDRVAPAFIYLL